LVYAGFAAVAIALFVMRPVREAAAWSYVGGWLILPVAAYPSFFQSATVTPIEIMGLVLPANMLVSKAAAVAAATCLASLIVDLRRWGSLRLGVLDGAMLAWCAWPLLRALLAGDPGSGWLPSAYLLAAWGGPWLLGKLYFAGEDGATALLTAMAWSGVALLPVALIELVTGPIVYTTLYGCHPFSMDGIVRYVGYRPLAMFEDGNQYGVWIAMAALAGIALAKRERRWRVSAIALVVAALASQSVGAIMLLALGAVILSGRLHVPARWWKAGAIVGGGGAALYLSGLLPLERIARHTSIGGHILAIVRSTGRGSMLWRVSQDQKVLPLVHQHVLIGWGRWDWWMPVGFRPWGVPMLAVGQYGLIGLAVMVAALLVAPVLALVRHGTAGSIGAIAVVVILAAADAALNAFIFWPAIIAAGALADRRLAPNAVDNPSRPLSKSHRTP